MTRLLLGLCLAAGLAAPAAAQRDFSDVEIKAEHAGGNVHVLFGAGGNIGVLKTEDGLILIDDQFAPLTDRILAAVKTIDDAPIRFLVNTHWHGDHTGGNENLGKAGVVIIAHDNVHKRLSTPQRFENAARNTEARPKEALPVISFNDELSLHVGEETRIHHYPHAHTDGDSVLHFTESNVVHMGDIFFVGRYPFIDLGSGGNLKGIIAAVEDALGFIDDDTAIIPGHGAVSTRADLAAYLGMLKQAESRVAALLAEGKSLEEITALKPMADHDDVWGSGFIKPEAFLKAVYDSLRSND